MSAKMTPAEINTFLLQGTRTGKLATVRADGRPHVVPIWFTLDGDDVLFMTGETTVKAQNIRRDGRVTLSVDDENPPFAFIMLEGEATVEDVSMDELLRWSTIIGGRYMGADRAEEFGRRNAVPGELLIRIRRTKVVAVKELAD